MTELRAYFDAEHAELGVRIRTAADLNRLLDQVRAEAQENRWSLAVQLLVADDPDTPEFAFGVPSTQADHVALYYSGRQWPGAWHSQGAATSTDPQVYSIMDHDIEFPDSSLVPLTDARRALHEYLTTGGDRPTAVDWHEHA